MYFLQGFIFAVYTLSLLYSVIMIPVILDRQNRLNIQINEIKESIENMSSDMVEMSLEQSTICDKYNEIVEGLEDNSGKRCKLYESGDSSGV